MVCILFLMLLSLEFSASSVSPDPAASEHTELRVILSLSSRQSVVYRIK